MNHRELQISGLRKNAKIRGRTNHLREERSANVQKKGKLE